MWQTALAGETPISTSVAHQMVEEGNVTTADAISSYHRQSLINVVRLACDRLEHLFSEMTSMGFPPSFCRQRHCVSFRVVAGMLRV